MIKVSAVLTATAIAVLVWGVVAGDLTVVYVSIGLSALSALLLAAGVVQQRAAIFGEQGVATRPPRPVTDVAAVTGSHAGVTGPAAQAAAVSDTCRNGSPGKGGPRPAAVTPGENGKPAAAGPAEAAANGRPGRSGRAGPAKKSTPAKNGTGRVAGRAGAPPGGDSTGRGRQGTPSERRIPAGPAAAGQRPEAAAGSPWATNVRPPGQAGAGDLPPRPAGPGQPPAGQGQPPQRGTGWPGDHEGAWPGPTGWPDKPVPDKPVPDQPVPDQPVPDQPVPDKLVQDKPGADRERAGLAGRPGDGHGPGSGAAPSTGPAGRAGAQEDSATGMPAAGWADTGGGQRLPAGTPAGRWPGVPPGEAPASPPGGSPHDGFWDQIGAELDSRKREPGAPPWAASAGPRPMGDGRSRPAADDTAGAASGAPGDGGAGDSQPPAPAGGWSAWTPSVTGAPSAPVPGGEETATPGIETSGAPAGKTADAPAGKTAEPPGGKTADAPDGKTAEPPGGKTADAPDGKAAGLPEPGAEATDAASRDTGTAAEPATAGHEAEEEEAAPSPWSIPLTVSELGDFDDDDWQPGELPAWANEPDEVIDDDEEAAAAVADPGAPGSGEDAGGGDAATSLVTDGGTATARVQSSGADAPSGDAHPDAVTPGDVAKPDQDEPDVARPGEAGHGEAGHDVAGTGEATPDEAEHDDAPDKPGPDRPGPDLTGGGPAEAAGAAADIAEADLAAADGTTSQAGAVTGATEEAVGDPAGGQGGASPRDATGGSAGTLGDEVAIVPGVARYHRPDCILIRFLGDGDLEPATRQQAEARGCVPCKACEPERAAPDGS